MKRKFLLILCLLLGIVLTSNSFAQYFQTAKAPAEVGFSAERLKRIDDLLTHTAGIPYEHPLEMKDTYFYLPADKASRLVPLYAKPKADEPMTLCDNDANRNFATKGAQTYYAGGTGLLGTIEDYAKVCQLILNGGTLNGKRLLGTKTVELMTRNQIGALKVLDRADHFGYGLQIITDHSRYGDQATPGSLTWGGAYCSECTIDPKEDLIMLVYTNIHPYAH